VAMTANSSGGYVASAHSEYPDGTNYHAFRVFNNRGVNVPYVAGVGWESANTDTFGDDGLWGGSNASGAPTSSSANTTMTLENGNTIYGEWLQIQLPTKIRLEYVNFLILSGSAHAMAHRAPRAGYVLGSNNGTNWTTLKNWSGIVYDTWTAYYDKFYKFDIDKEVDNYQYFRFVWTETASGSGNSLSRYASCQELEFWGVPEYDPEAHGTDVTIKSVANVPNTDWLEVYYDAKGLENAALSTASGAISGLGGTTNNGTAYGNPQISGGAFVLDGTGDYISTSVNATLTYHTASMWIMFDNPSTWEAVYYLGPASGLSLGNNFAIYVHADNYFSLETSGAKFGVNYTFQPGKWVHMTVVFKGTGLEDCEVYIDNVKLSPRGGSASLNPTADLTITGTNNLNIGGRYLTANGLEYQLEGKIANFRLFNRILTTDEIYQLYAYQKEYFGYGDLSMTLKAGRLGIGTSEPRAMLDVRGNIQFSLIISHRSINSDTHSSAGRASVSNFDGTNPDASYIPFDTILYENPPGIHNTKVFSCPVKGLYECHADLLTNNGPDYDGDHEWIVNDVSLSIQRRGWSTTANGSRYVQATSHHYIELNAGDTIGIVNRSNQVWYGSAGNAHSHMSIRLITPT